MPAKKEPDRIDVNRETGVVTVYLNGKAYPLRRPKLGEQRRFEDQLAEIRVRQDEDALWVIEQAKVNEGQIAAADHVETTKRAHARQEDRVRWWWDSVIPTLCELKLPDVPFDDLPLEFANGQIITAASETWATGPQAPGGS